MAPPRIPSITVAERPTGSGRYSVRWREHGSSREERGHTSKAEAQDAATLIRQRLRQGLPGVRERLTVAELVGAWWDRYASTEKLSAATTASYRTAVARILPELGSVDANRVTAPMLIDWAESLDLSPRIVNVCLTALSSAFQRGVEWGLVETNPVRSVPKRAEPPRSVQIPSRADVIRLAATAPTLRERAMLCIAVYGGLRFGEQLALQWHHIGDDGVRVEQAVDLRGKLKATKTSTVRVVPLPAPVIALLAEHRATSPWSKPTDPVFASKRGTRLSPSPWRRDAWHPWREAASTPALQWRTLRHFYASTLAGAGATIVQASRWMGHGTIRTTIDRYAFLFDEDAAAVMNRL